MEKRELQILSMLRANSRESLTRMSKKTSIPISTIFEKLKNYERQFIHKHTSLIHFDKLGFTTIVKILLRVKREDKVALKDYLLKNIHVNSLCRINNNFDFMVEGIFKNLRDLEDFQEKLDERFSIKAKQYYFIIDDIKREEFMSDSNLVEMTAS